MIALRSNTQQPSAKNVILMSVFTQNTFSNILQCAHTHTHTSSNFILHIKTYTVLTIKLSATCSNSRFKFCCIYMGHTLMDAIFGTLHKK